MVQDFLVNDISMFQATAIFGAGLLVGIVNLAAAIYQGKVCANGIAAIGNGHDVMGKTLMLAAFPELYAILTVAATYLITTMIAGEPEAAASLATAAVETVETAADAVVDTLNVVAK